MDCASCASKIETALRSMPAIINVAVSVQSGTLMVDHLGNANLAAVEGKVTGLGYKISPLSAATPAQHGAHEHESISGRWWNTRKGLQTIAAGLALVVAYLVGKLIPQIAPFAFGAAMLIGLVPIARRSIMAAFAGTLFSIETLMTVAAVGALIIGAGEEGATVVFLFLVGELLEGVASSKARASIQSLATLVPKTALLEANGQTREVPAESLAVGMVSLVRPGDRIPADGVIVSGESSIDEAPVTGESMPVRKGLDAKVFAGTVNGEAALRIQVTAAAADNTIARVVKLVEEAQESKAPTERFIARFSRWYTPAVVLLAALVAIVPPLSMGAQWSVWIYKGLAILLIGCPCALVISTPAAIAAALSAGARNGLLLKGGAVLESLRKVTIVAFDKTGTLTEGRPKVTDVVSFTDSEAGLLKYAAALSVGSSHPLSQAILDRAETAKIPVLQASDGKAIVGKGVTAIMEGDEIFLGSASAAEERAPLSRSQKDTIGRFADEGKSLSVIVSGNKVLGIIAMRDEARPDAKIGLKLLTDAGIKVLMLTGDNSRTAAAIGKQLAIDV